MTPDRFERWTCDAYDGCRGHVSPYGTCGPWPPHEHDGQPAVRFDVEEKTPTFNVLEPCWVWSSTLGAWALIPVGRHTDLATVPWWARWLVPVTALGIRAVALHDELYRNAGRVTLAPAPRDAPERAQRQFAVEVYLDRDEADRLLYDTALADGRSLLVSWLAFLGVRTGGRYPDRDDLPRHTPPDGDPGP